MSWTFGANENGTFTLPAGQFTVRYGAGSSYNTKVMAGVVHCNNATFGDSDYGVVKHCDYQPVIVDLQAALNATPKGGTLDAHGQVFRAVQITVPPFVTLANAEFDYSGSAATQQSDFIDLGEGAALVNVTERAAP